MDTNKLIQFAFKFEGKKIGIYGTGTGSIKVINALGILYKDVVCFFETEPTKQKFLDKPVFQANQDNMNKVDAIIVASEYYAKIREFLKRIHVDITKFYFSFENVPISAIERSINHIRKEENVSIGRKTYTTKGTIDDYSNVDSIGSFTSINTRASIGGGNHPMYFVSTHPFLYGAQDKSVYEKNDFIEKSIDISKGNPKIAIGNDVWIATNAVILPGVTIGDGAVIGAGAIVTKDIPPYAIAVGVPAKIIKYRFSKEIIEGLLKIKWWNWPDEKIKANIDYFYDPEKFVAKFLPEIEE